MKEAFNKFKEFFSISTLAKILVLALIVITTLFPSLFDPQNADWKKVIYSFILNLIIFMGAFISQLIASKKREMEKARYIESNKKHIDEIHLIQNRKLSHFHKLYVQDENEKNKIEYIQDVFTQFEIDMKFYTMELSLVKTAIKNNIITKEQYSVIQLCRKGKIDFDKYDVRDLTTTQILKKGKNSNKSQQATITASNLLGKISWILAFAIIWGMFVFDNANEGVSDQAWIDLGSRLMTFAGGIITGEVTGKECVNDDIRLFDKFFNFNCKFIQDFELGIWKPKKEDINEDLIDRLKKLQSNIEIIDNEPKNEQNDNDSDYEEVEMSESEYKDYLKSHENNN